MSKRRAPVPSFAVETITPQKAAEYLARNTSNRRLTKATVRRYADAMRRGEWQLNGEAIKFDDEGRLIDGQHRLTAIVESGATVQAAVVRELPHSTFPTIDTGRPRSHGDVFSIVGLSYPTETASAARLLYLYVNGGLAARRPITSPELLKFLDEHEQLVECVERAQRNPLYTRLLPHSARGFAYYAATRIDQKRADQFFTELASGIYQNARGVSQPVYMLRERLQQVAAEEVATPPIVKLGWVILAWNAFLAKRDLGRLSRLPAQPPRFRPDPFERLRAE